MKNVVLHIGTGKTGTSTIQNTLYYLRDALRKRCSVDYSSCGLSKVEHYGEKIYAHYQLVEWLTQKNVKQLDALHSHILDSPCDTIIFSCEGLYHHLGKTELALLSELFSDFNVSIICYVRRQDLYMESAYKQQVKVGEFKMPFHEFLKRHTDEQYLAQVHANYLRILTMWESFFNASPIKVIPFERSYFKNGDLMDSFFSVLNISDIFESEEKHIFSNPAFPSELIGIIQYYNALGIIPNSRRQDFVAFLGEQVDYRASTLVDEVARRKIIENYSEVNKELFEKFNIAGQWGLPEVTSDKSINAEAGSAPLRSEKELLANMLYDTWVDSSRSLTGKLLLKKVYYFCGDIFWLLKSLIIPSPKINDVKGRGYRLLICDLVFSRLFSPTYYYRANKDLAVSKCNPFEHYLQYGWKEGRAPNPNATRRDIESISTGNRVSAVSSLVDFLDYNSH